MTLQSTGAVGRLLSLATLCGALLGTLAQLPACPSTNGAVRALADEGAAPSLGVTVTSPAPADVAGPSDGEVAWRPVDEETGAGPDAQAAADNGAAGQTTAGSPAAPDAGAAGTDAPQTASGQTASAPGTAAFARTAELPDGLDADQLADLAGTPCGPDATRALETGVPMAGGASASPADVLLAVAAQACQRDAAPQVEGCDPATGRIAYHTAPAR